MIGDSRIHTNFAIKFEEDTSAKTLHCLLIILISFIYNQFLTWDSYLLIFKFRYNAKTSEVFTTSKVKGYSCAKYIPQVAKKQVLLRT